MGRLKGKARWPGTRCVKDRNGDPKYWYVRPLDGGAEIRLTAEHGTLDWEREYLAARGGGKAPVRILTARKSGSPARMTLREGAERYLRSVAFRNLADVTRRKGKYYLNRLVEDCPDAILGELTKEVLADVLSDLRPHIHIGIVGCVRRMYAHLGLPDPTVGYVWPKPVDSKGFRAWKEDHLVAFRARWPLGTLERTIMELAYHTCQRRSDLTRMHWTDIVDVIGDDGQTYRAIHVLSQHKTKATVLIPIDPDLQEVLDAWKDASSERERELTARIAKCPPYNLAKRLRAEERRAQDRDLILKSKRRLYGVTPQFYSRTFMTAVIAAGLPVYKKWMDTFEHVFSGHGLRKAGMNAIAEAGGTPLMIMSISGHTDMKSVSHYVKDAERMRAAVAAVQMRRASMEKQQAAKAKASGAQGNIVRLKAAKPDGSV